MNDNKVMNMAADNIRILAASMVEKAKSGHPGAGPHPAEDLRRSLLGRSGLHPDLL